MHISEDYFRNDTVHRFLGGEPTNGILSCGFINQKYNTAAAEHIVFEYYGALLLLSGEGTHTDNEGRVYRLTPGCFVQRIPGKPHSTLVKTDGQWLEFFICFGRDLFESLAAMNLMTARQDVLYPGVNPAIFHALTGFLSTLRQAPDEELPLLLCEAQRIVLTIYGMHRRNSGSQEDRELIRQACLLLGDQREDRKTARDVAGQLGVGYESFRKMFKRETGMAPGEYAIQSRINAARSMLIDTGASVKEVASRLGFPDAFTFSRQFTEVVGMPPSQYKKMY